MNLSATENHSHSKRLPLALATTALLIFLSLPVQAWDRNLDTSVGQSFFLNHLSWGPPADLEEAAPCTAAGDAEVQLVHVTSDVQSGYLDIKAAVDEVLNLAELRYASDKNVINHFSLAELEKGAVLMKSDDREVVKIVAHSLNPTSGSSLEMIYLTDGISDSYSSFNMELVRSGNDWHLETPQNSGKRRFSNMNFKGRYFFGKVIGISEITVN